MVRKFLNEQPIQGWVGLDTDGSVFSAYKPGGRPHTVLVDQNWKIAAITYADKVTAAVLDDLLAGKLVSLPLKPLGDSSAVDLAKTGGELFQATIQPSNGSGPLYGAMLIAPGRIESDGLPLLSAIVAAYRTSNYRTVESVPLPKEFYKFKVLVPKGREELIYPVFQQALEVAFGLKTRREMREVDVFVLKPVSDKGPSLQPSQASDSTERTDKGFIRGKKQPIKNLVALLEGMFLKAPVVDESGLTKEYDWDLPYNRASNNLLVDSIRTQLGLEVVRAKRRIEFLVIEGVAPTAMK